MLPSTAITADARRFRSARTGAHCSGLRPGHSSLSGDERRQERKQPEQQQAPRPDRHRQPWLEHRSAGVRLDKHVPEPFRPIEIDREQQPADADPDERHEISQAREPPVVRPAEEVQQRRQQEAAPGDSADEEVEDDPPGPVRRGGEEGIRHPCSSRSPPARPCGASSGPRTRAARARWRPPPRRASSGAGCGYGIFGARGRPYTSGSSTSR